LRPRNDQDARAIAAAAQEARVEDRQQGARLLAGQQATAEFARAEAVRQVAEQQAQKQRELLAAAEKAAVERARLAQLEAAK